MEIRKCGYCKHDKPIEDFPMVKVGPPRRAKCCNKCYIFRRKYAESHNKIRQEIEWKKRHNPEYRKTYLEDLRKRQSYETRLPWTAYSQYRNGAKDRNFDFAISFEEFMTFWQKPCFFCDSPIPTIGLDRLDCKAGYLKENLVPCCKTCNYMKLQLSIDKFIEMCHIIASHHPKPRDNVQEHLDETIKLNMFM